jgi:hypothetical protein
MDQSHTTHFTLTSDTGDVCCGIFTFVFTLDRQKLSVELLKIPEDVRRNYYNVMITTVDGSDSWNKWYVNLNKLYKKKGTFNMRLPHLGDLYVSVTVIGKPVYVPPCVINNHGIQSLSDVTFKCADGELVRGCRCLLACVSPVFRTMFCGDFKKEDVVEYDDISVGDMRKLITYSEKRTYIVSEYSSSLIVVFDRFLISSVVTEWCSYARDTVNAKNAIELYGLATQVNSVILLSECKDAIIEFGEAITNFDLLDKADLISIIRC